MSEFKGILYHWGKHMKPKVVELASVSPSLLVLDVGDKLFSLTCWSGSISSPFVVSSWRTYDYEERSRSVFNCERINPDGSVVCTFQFSARECNGFIQAIQPDDPPTPAGKPFVRGTAKGFKISVGDPTSDDHIIIKSMSGGNAPKGIINLLRAKPVGWGVWEVEWESAYGDRKGVIECQWHKELERIESKPVYKYKVIHGELVRGTVDGDTVSVIEDIGDMKVVRHIGVGHGWHDTPQRAMDAWLDQWDFENARRIVARNDMVLKLIKQAGEFK